MTEDAEEYFYNWYNNIIDSTNAIEDDAEVRSRKMKLNGHAGRLALIFQLMKWAVDGEDVSKINLSPVKAAIRMIDYYEETYDRIEDWLTTLVI